MSTTSSKWPTVLLDDETRTFSASVAGETATMRESKPATPPLSFVAIWTAASLRNSVSTVLSADGLPLMSVVRVEMMSESPMRVFTSNQSTWVGEVMLRFGTTCSDPTVVFTDEASAGERPPVAATTVHDDDGDHGTLAEGTSGSAARVRTCHTPVAVTFTSWNVSVGVYDVTPLLKPASCESSTA